MSEYDRLKKAAQQMKSEQVWDADSTIGADGTEFRLKGLDAPERDHGDTPAEPLSDEAMQFLGELIDESGGAQREVEDKGFYGRDLGVLRGNDGRDLNAELAKTGAVNPARYGDDYADEFEIAHRRLSTDMGDLVSDPATRRRMDQVEAAQDEAWVAREQGELLRGYKQGLYDGDRRSTFKTSFHRGLDQSQAMLFGAANAVGELFEFDAVADWGLEGVERNLKEAAMSPAEIHSYENIESLSDAWTYVVEAIGEQAPQLAVDLTAGLLSGGASAAGSMAARAGAAKMLKRQVGEQAFGKLLAKAGAAQQPFAKGFKYGVLGGMQAQMTGEAQLEFIDQGIDAPGSAIATGAINTFIEFKALKKVLEPILKSTKRAGTDPLKIRDVMGTAFRQAGIGIPTEGLTEMAQTFTTKLAAMAHGGESAFSDAAISEYINAGIKGGVVGGALSGGASILGSAYQKMGEGYVEKIQQADQAINAATQNFSGGGIGPENSSFNTEQMTGGVQEESTPQWTAEALTPGQMPQQQPTDYTSSVKPGDQPFDPEPEQNLDAQQQRVGNPRFEDRVMFISKQNRSWGKRIEGWRKQGLPAIAEDDAVILFADEQAKQEYVQVAKEQGSVKARQMVKGYTQDINQVRPETAQAVQRVDTEGRVIEEEAVDPGQVEQAIQNQGQKAAEGDQPRVVPVQQAMAERQQQVEAEGYIPPEHGEGVFGSGTANTVEQQSGQQSKLWGAKAKNGERVYPNRKSAQAGANGLRRKGESYTVIEEGGGFRLKPEQAVDKVSAPDNKTKGKEQGSEPERMERSGVGMDPVLRGGGIETEGRGRKTERNVGGTNTRGISRGDVRGQPRPGGRSGGIDGLVFAPNGKPWPFYSAAESEAKKKSGEFEVIELSQNAFALKERPADERREKEENNNDDSATGVVQDGKSQKGAGGAGTDGAGGVSGAGLETLGEAVGEIQETRGLRGENLLRQRIKAAGVSLPTITQAQIESLRLLAEKDTASAADAKLLFERAQKYVDYFGLELLEATRLAAAESIVIRQEEEAYFSEMAENRPDNVILDTTGSNDLGDNLADYNDNSAEFSDNLRIQDIEEREDGDSPEKVAQFLTDRNVPPSSFEEMQERYLDWAQAKFPTYEFQTVDKPDANGNTHKTFTRTVTDKNGKRVKKTYKMPFRTVKGEKKVFATAKEALEYAKQLGLRRKGNLFHPKKEPDGKGYILEKLRRPSHELADNDNIDAYFEEYVAKARKQARAANGASQNIKKIEFRRLADWVTGEPMNENVLLHAPTLTEMGRKIAPYMERNENGKETRTMDEKHALWFNYALAVLVDRGYMPRNMEIDTGRTDKSGNPILKPRNIAFTPELIPQTTDDYFRKRRELGRMLDRLTELEKREVTLRELVARVQKKMKRAASGLIPSETKRLDGLNRKIKNGLSLIDQLLSFQNDLLRQERSGQVSFSDIEQDIWSNAAAIMEAREHLQEAVNRRNNVKGQDHGVDLGPVLKDLGAFIRELNTALREVDGERSKLRRNIKQQTNRKLDDFDREDFEDAPAGSTDSSQVIGKDNSVPLAPDGILNQEVSLDKDKKPEGVVTYGIKSNPSPDDSVAGISNLSLEERDGYEPKNPRSFDTLNDDYLTKVPKLKKEPKVTINGSSITKDEQDFVNNVLKKLGAKMNVRIVDRHWYDVNKDELPKHKKVLPTATMKGFYLDLEGEHLIVLNDFKSGAMPKGKAQKGDADKKREIRGQRMFILAHELAHALEQRFFNNLSDNQKNILADAYQKYRETGGGLTKREWLADKVGVHLYDKASKKGSYSKEDTVARNIAARLRTFYRAAADFIKQRFGLDKGVSQVMDELIASGAFRGLIENRGKTDPVAFELDPSGKEVLGPTMARMKGLALAIKKQVSKAGVAWKVSTFLRTSDSQLRDLDEDYADAWHLAPGSKKTLMNRLTGKVLNGGFHFRVLSARGRLWSEFMDTKVDGKSIKDYYHKPKGIFSIHEQVKPEKQKEVMEAIKELNDGGPYTTDFAKLVRKALDTLHSGYLKHALPTMGYLENYFPVVMNTMELTGQRDLAKQIMVKYKADEWTKQHVKRLEDQGVEIGEDEYQNIQSNMLLKAEATAEEVIDNILNGGGSYELAVLMDQSVLGPGFVHNRARDWFNDPKMVEELNKHNLMETDFAKMMFNYVASSVKRAEFERGFGGYTRLKGATEPTSARQWIRDRISKKALTPEDINDLERKKGEMARGEEAIEKAYAWNLMGVDPLDLKHQLKRFHSFMGMDEGSESFGRTRDKIYLFEQTLTGDQYEKWAELKDMIKDFGDSYHKPMLDKLKHYGYLTETPNGDLSFYSPAAGIKKHLEDIFVDKRESGRKRAETLTRANLGQLGSEIDPDVQAAMSTIMAYESVLVLAFSTLSSFPDIVGGVLRNRDISGMFNGMKEMGALWKKQAFSRDEYKLLKDEVREVGLIGQRISQAVLQEMFGSSYSSEKSQQVLDALFHFNGQEAWTNYTRVVNYQLAKSSIKRWVDLAKGDDPKAKEYLKEFGITAEEYGKWDGKVFKAGDVQALETLKGDARKKEKAALALRAKIQAAHTRFVEESVVRPDASQRPAWASDPRFMLVWHLKSFFYSYGKIIVLPFLSHLQGQIAAAGKGKKGADKIMLYGKETAVQALPLITAGVLLFGLAAFGWEARELLQYNAFGKEGRTDNMAWDQYLFELSSRAGVYGPGELALNVGAGYGDSDRRAAALLGPTFDHLITLLKSDWDQKLYRSTPLLNQLPGLKQSLSE